MSAQIITALRKRATALETEAHSMQRAGVTETQADAHDAWRSLAAIRFLASELRALADQAEAP